MKYGKSKVLICEIMGFVRISEKSNTPRGLLAKNWHCFSDISPVIL